MLDRTLRTLAATLLLLAPAGAAPVDVHGDVHVNECVAARGAGVALATTTNGQVHLIDAATGKARATARLDADLVGAVVSPDGTRVAVIDTSGVVHQAGASLETFTRSEPLIPTGKPLSGSRLGVAMAFSPDSTALLADVGPAGALVLDLEGKRIAAIPSRRGGWASSRACWTADGRSVFALTDDGLGVFDARTGESRGDAFAVESRMLSFGLHPSEPLVATGHRNGALLEWSLETGEVVRRWQHEDPMGFDGDQYVNCVSYDPQGERIGFTTGSGVFLGVVGRGGDDPPWYSWYCDGRAGTPAPLAWDPEGITVWWAFVGGQVALHHHETDGVKRFGETVDVGWTPTFDGEGHGVTLSKGRAIGFDASTHEPLWTLDAATLGADSLDEKAPGRER